MNTIERLGLSAAGRDRIERRMQRYVDLRKVAGLVTLLARPDGEPYVKAYGVRDRETGDPMTETTLVRIASLTKPITAAATLMLVESGALALDDPVSRYIPAFDDFEVLVDSETDRREALARPITTRHLLTHTGGLGYGLLAGPVESRYRQAGLLRMDQDELVSHLPKLPLVFQPGEGWHYSIGYEVLGYLIQVVTGEPFEQFLRSRIFAPLGMGDTGFVVPEVLAHRLAAFYSAPGDAGFTRIETSSERSYTDPNRPRSGGGGLVSTARDYLRFVRMLLSGGELEGTRLLQAETVRQMTANQLPSSMIPIDLGTMDLAGNGYGFGFGVRVAEPQTDGEPSKGAYWWAGITGTFAWGDPELNLAGIVMVQASRYYEPGRAFQRLVYRGLRS